jgi:hypothetical protein
MQVGPYRQVLILFLLFTLLINPAFSLKYELLNNDSWEKSSLENIFKDGYIGYDIMSGKTVMLKVLEDGNFTFAWKMDGYNQNNILYFRNTPLDCTNAGWIIDTYKVNNNDILSWSFYASNASAIASIAIHEDIAINQTNLINKTVNQTNLINKTINQTNLINKAINQTNLINKTINQTVRLDQTEYLQELISISQNNSTLNLPESIYLINNTLIIENKFNISIGPKEGQTKLIGQNVEKMLLIENSNNITISRLKLNNTRYGISIENCNYTEIKQNEIDFRGEGISIFKGRNNTIKNNKIYNVSDSCKKGYLCVGVNLTHTSNNNLADNLVYTENRNGMICHYLINDSCNRNNKIKFKELANGLLVAQDGCFSSWNSELNSFESIKTFDGILCMMNDEDDKDPLMWVPLC